MIFDRLKKKQALQQVDQSQKSYAQSGEDIIIDFALNTIGIKSRSYIDIGTNEPKKLSNTYYFYEKGFKGICVEPDSTLCKQIKEVRPRDKCLNVGIGDANDTLTFYIMNPNTLNTFSKEEVEQSIEHYPWVTLEKEQKIKVVNINDMLAKHKFKTGDIDIMSIDTEGLDWDIITAMDIDKYRPKVFCIETAEYLDKKVLAKNTKLIKYLHKNNYFTYADTFVDKKVWKNNNGPKLKGY